MRSFSHRFVTLVKNAVAPVTIVTNRIAMTTARNAELVKQLATIDAAHAAQAVAEAKMASERARESASRIRRLMK